MAGSSGAGTGRPRPVHGIAGRWIRCGLAAGLLAICGLARAQSPFLRGDANGDGVVSMADASAVLNLLFPRGPRSLCPAAADADGDGVISAADAIRIVGYLAGEAPSPPPPFPEFGFPEEVHLPCPMGIVRAPAVNDRAYLFLEETTCEPGGVAVVRIELRGAPVAEGAALRLCYDARALRLEDGAIAAEGDAGPGFRGGGELAPGEAVLGFLARDAAAGIADGTVAELRFRVDPRARDGDAFVELVEGPGGTEIVRAGQAVYPRTYGGAIRISRVPLEPPRDLASGSFRAVPQLRWTNGDAYDQVLVERDRDLVAILSGGAEAFADEGCPPGPHAYRVRGMRGAERSPGAFARYEGLWTPPPAELTATPSEGADAVELAWRNGAAYDAVEIERNGETIALVGGRFERFVDRSPAGGLNVYFVSGLVAGARTERAVATALILPAVPRFVRGDANRDGTVSLSDVAFLRALLAGEAGAPPCLDACDADDDGRVTGNDPLAILLALFRDGGALPPPGVLGGTDPTPDGLGCEDGRVRWGAFDPSNLVWIETVEAACGEAVLLPVFATITFDVEAIQIVLSYDPQALEVIGADWHGTIVEAHGLDDPEIGLVSDWPDRGYVTVAIPGTARAGGLAIPAFEARPVVRLRLRVRAGAAGIAPIVPRDGLGPYGLRNEFTYRGRAVYATIYPRTVGGGIRIRGDNPGTLDFLRGDANTDGRIDVADGIFLASYLYAGGPAPRCADAADANDDGRLDAGDPIAIVMFVFGGGGPLAELCATCAPDRTGDRLPACAEHPCFARIPGGGGM